MESRSKTLKRMRHKAQKQGIVQSIGSSYICSTDSVMLDSFDHMVLPGFHLGRGGHLPPPWILNAPLGFEKIH